VQAVVLSSVAIRVEAALAFLGVGIAPPTPSWGGMLRVGDSYLYDSPTYAVLPGVVLTLTILALDALRRGLAAALDDRQDAVMEIAPGRDGERCSVIGFFLRRLLQLAPVVLIASVGVWAIIYAIPGGPVAALLGDSAIPEQVPALTAFC
jgi:hypothetical protein